jgi:protein-tyrosine phosphatase
VNKTVRQKMKSVFWLIRDVIAGRPGPELEPWSIAELRAAGIDAVINLSEHPSDFGAFEAAGMEANWVPLPTDVPPTKESEEQCVEALPRAIAFVSAQISKSRRVLVHCHAGKDRTGMLLAVLVAKKENLSAASAIQRVREVRPLAITAPGWEALALKVIPRVVAKCRDDKGADKASL